jgi:signal transduction histidine kinase
MAASPTSHELVQILCQAAIEQCQADVSALLRVVGDEAEVIASAGPGAPRVGYRYGLAGTATSLAMHRRAIVAETTERAAARTRPAVGLRAANPGFEAGPFVITPLVAHGEVLGALALMRETGAPSFTSDEEERLSVIADHAAIALRKARLVEEAQAANQAKSNFLAVMSHELRTPLTALTGYGELLADEILGPMPPQQREVIERMRAVTHHLTVMIDDILTFSGIEAGRERVRLEDVSTADLLRGAAAILEPVAQKKGIQFHAKIPAMAPSIRTDADKVRQILVNLGSNAIKFTDNGEVGLELQPTTTLVRFHVSDTGIGISPEHLKHIFQPFGQVDTGLTRRHGGTGLGLYISHRLAGFLGGKIEVSSLPGTGSRFTLVLPHD